MLWRQRNDCLNEVREQDELLLLPRTRLQFTPTDRPSRFNGFTLHYIQISSILLIDYKHFYLLETLVKVISHNLL